MVVTSSTPCRPRWPAARTVALPAGVAGRPSAGDRGVLELVQRRPVDLVEQPLDRRLRLVGVAVRALEQADEHRLVGDDERRHAPHRVGLDERRVLLLDGRQRATAVHLGPHRVDVDADALEHRRQVAAVLDLSRRAVAVLVDRVVGVDELVGLGVADGQRGLQGDDAGVLLGLLPHRRLALFDVGLAERERQERHVPVGPRPERRHDVLVHDAGPGAAVVEGQAELSRHGDVNRRAAAMIPVRRRIVRAPRPSTVPTAIPATTSEAWWMRTYALLTATVEASVHHSGAERLSSHDVSRTAVNAAALACPDGNDDVSGRRTGYRGSPSAVGCGRLNSRFRPWLTSRLSTPRANASTGVWAARRSLVRPRDTLTMCQIRLQSPSLVADMNTVSADRKST